MPAREDETPILLSGFAYRPKVASDGGRQIVALKLPGDALDLQSLYLRKADHDVRMLTPSISTGWSGNWKEWARLAVRRGR